MDCLELDVEYQSHLATQLQQLRAAAQQELTAVADRMRAEAV